MLPSSEMGSVFILFYFIFVGNSSFEVDQRLGSWVIYFLICSRCTLKKKYDLLVQSYLPIQLLL